MKKRIIALLFAVALCLVTAAPAFATSDIDYFYDDVPLIDNQANTDKIENRLIDLKNKYKIDVAIITVASMNGMSGKDFAEYAHESIGYSSDCVMLLVSMEYRDVTVSSFGDVGGDVFSVSDCDSIRESITPALSEGDYYSAFMEFADAVDNEIYYTNNFNIPLYILISVGVGLVIALIVVLVLKAQLKSVRYQAAAANYLKNGSMNVTNAYEQFLYRHVDRVKIERESNSSSGSSNSSSGKF